MKRSITNKQRTYALSIVQCFVEYPFEFLNPSSPMRNPIRKSSLFSHEFMPFHQAKGHVFLLGLLLIAAIPAAILTCAIMLPVKLVQWLRR